MTPEEAIERMRARWDHPPLDPRDVEERVALRYRDAADPPETRVLRTRNACRVFVRDGWIEPKRAGDVRRPRWCSAYVHAAADVDAALAWIEAQIATRRAEAAERAKAKAERVQDSTRSEAA